MKIIILAAGQGTRLDLTKPAPKTLTCLIDGRTILDHQLDGLKLYADLADLIVVIGFQYQLLLEAYPDLMYVYNPDFSKENTAKSLLRAASKVKEDLLFINADVVFHPNALKALLNYRDTAMMVTKESLDEEAVKYLSDPTGAIIEVSKQVQNPQGEAVGINYFSKKDLTKFLFHLGQCQKGDYFEKAIESFIREGGHVQSIPVLSSQVTEIDFPEDLIHANKLISLWTKSKIV